MSTLTLGAKPQQPVSKTEAPITRTVPLEQTIPPARAQVSIRMTNLGSIRVREDQGRASLVIRTDKFQAVTDVKAKAWRKAVTACEAYAQWVMVLEGDLASVTHDRLVLINTGIQVFEKVKKPVAEPIAETA